MKKLLTAIAISAVTLAAAQAQLYWRLDNTSATWTSTSWGSDPAGPFGSGWTAGSNAVFNADSTITYVTATSFGNVTVADGITVTVTQAGTVPAGTHIMNVGAGSSLVWASQNYNTSTGFTKDGDGIWNLGAISNAYTGGFILNAGTVIVSGNNSFGGSSSTLTINGGTIQSSGARTYAVGDIVVNSDFTITGTGGWTMNMPVSLGSSVRTINMTATGTKTWNGEFSGVGGGMRFQGTGTHVFTGTNTFTGNLFFEGGEVEFQSAASLGNGSNLTIDGGRLALRGAFTVDSAKSIFLGAGAELSTPGGSSSIVYNGILADKLGDTGDLVKQGQGVLELGGQSTFTGITQINNGVIRLTTGDDRLPTSTVLGLGQAASANLGTLDLNGFNQEIAGLQSVAGTNATINTNTVTSVAASTLTLNVAAADSFLYGTGTAANSGVISGAVSIVKTGDGEQVFGGDNSYSGGTTVSGGILRANSNSAFGSGSAQVITGGSMIVSGGVSLNQAQNNSLVVEADGLGGSYVKEFNDGESFTNFGTVRSGGAVDQEVSASLLAGSASGAGLAANVSFSSINPATNAFPRGAVLNLTGINGELFVLQLTYSGGVQEGFYLGWFNGSDWVNAVDGNSGAGGLFGYAGDISFAQFNLNNGAFGANYLGAWGIDSANNSVWAVLDHNSSFAVIPEPSSMALLAVGLGYLALRRRRKA